MATTDFSGTADLARRRYELSKSRTESNLAQRLGGIGQQYYGLARQLEGGLEARGILRSGEANRRRVELGAEEKAARLAQSQQAEQDIQSAALDYASVLAEIQAKNGVTTSPTTPTAPSASTTPTAPSTPTTPTTPTTPKTGDFVGGPDRKLGNGAVVDGVYLGPELGDFFAGKQTSPTPTSGGGGAGIVTKMSDTVTPQPAPVQAPVSPPVSGMTEPKPVGSGQIELGGVALPATEWQKTLELLQKAIEQPSPPPATQPAPVSPIAPITPVAPVAPVAPIAPIAPVAPVAPVAPLTPPALVVPVATTPTLAAPTVYKTGDFVGGPDRKLGNGAVVDGIYLGPELGSFFAGTPEPATTLAPNAPLPGYATALPKPGGQIMLGGITLPAAEWEAAFKALEAAALRR